MARVRNDPARMQHAGGPGSLLARAGSAHAGIIDPACRSMLTRYIGEARQKSFAVYMGNETEGVIRPVG